MAPRVNGQRWMAGRERCGRAVRRHPCIPQRRPPANPRPAKGRLHTLLLLLRPQTLRPTPRTRKP
eukprot:3385763-Prymnesium_polylepis.1